MKPIKNFSLRASRLIALFGLLLLAPLPAQRVESLTDHSAPQGESAAQKEKRKPVKVLFIGNSYTYTNDLPSILKQLAESAQGSKPIKVKAIVKAGATLKMHWDDAEAVRLLQEARWDYVVLQEQSFLPITNAEMMYTYVRRFDAEIKKAGAQTLLFVTWARQNRPETQPALTDAYQRIAKEINATIVPVGIAWQNAEKINPKISLYVSDQSHPNPLGSYISACVFYSVIFGKSPMGLTRQIVDSSNGTARELFSINETDAKFLQQIAWETVRALRHNQPAAARRGKQATAARRATRLSPLAMPNFVRASAFA